MSKQLVFGKEAKDQLIEGVRKLSMAVTSTLGPFGKNVIMKRHYNPPYITKDGITVARDLRLLDQVEDIGLLMVRQAAKSTADNSGDGTTTTTLLSYKMLEEASKIMETDLSAFKNITVSKKIFHELRNVLIEFIKSNKLNYPSEKDMILDVSVIATNHDEELYNVVFNCFDKLDRYADVILSDTLSTEVSYEIHTGMYFEGGYLSKHFITDPVRNICELEKPIILVTNIDIERTEQVAPLLRRLQHMKRTLLIICPTIRNEALIALNKHAEHFRNVCVVKNPGVNIRREELLQDIATLTNAHIFSKEKGEDLEVIGDLKDWSGYLGFADKAIIRMDSTTLTGIDTKSQKAIDRRTYIENRMEGIDDIYLRKRYEKRLSSFTSGVGIINVGGHNEPEVKEKKDRLDDAICAVKSALDDGVTLGGGFLFNEFAKLNEKELMKTPEGKVIYAGLISPILQIWNVNGNQNVPDNYADYLKAHNVVDPIKVLIDCIKNSIQVVHHILTTDCIIIDDEESNQILGDMPSIEEIAHGPKQKVE
jgi:chaperonin GroEL